MVVLTSSEDDDVVGKDLASGAAVPTNVDEVWFTPDANGAVVLVAAEPDEVDGHSLAVVLHPNTATVEVSLADLALEDGVGVAIDERWCRGLESFLRSEAHQYEVPPLMSH